MLDCLDESALSPTDIDRLFLQARTHSAWLDTPVPAGLLKTLFQMTVMGPTAANCLPMRLCFVQSPQAKARLLPLMAAGNVEKTRTAPVSAIVAYDLTFYRHLNQLFPHEPDAPSWFTGDPQATRDAALRNASLQGGYFIMAARALGLDAGPMGGFNADGVAQAFFPGQPYEVNFICNLGYADHSALHPRLPRLSFEQACSIV